MSFVTCHQQVKQWPSDGSLNYIILLLCEVVRPSVGHTVQRSIATANESKFKSSIQLPGEETRKRRRTRAANRKRRLKSRRAPLLCYYPIPQPPSTTPCRSYHQPTQAQKDQDKGRVAQQYYCCCIVNQMQDNNIIN